MAIGGVVAVAAIAIVVVYLLGLGRLSATYEITPVDVPALTDSTAIERGRHLVHEVSLCSGCHGADLSGQPFIEDEALGVMYAPNITSGEGGIGALYSREDWTRAIRDGVKLDGTAVQFMPVPYYNRLSLADLSSIIAFLGTVEPVDNILPEPEFTFMATALMGAGVMGDPFVELVDHESIPPAIIPEVSVAYGDYLASIAGCRECHGNDLGGRLPDGPGPPPAPNITPGGNPGSWSKDDFFRTIRTGVRPSGVPLAAVLMPWNEYNLTDDELEALWMFLSSLPPQPNPGG